METYILPDDRAKTRHPKHTRPTNFVYEQSLTAEHGFADSLTLILRHNALCASQESVAAHRPCLFSTELDDCDVAD